MTLSKTDKLALSGAVIWGILDVAIYSSYGKEAAVYLDFLLILGLITYWLAAYKGEKTPC